MSATKEELRAELGAASVELLAMQDDRESLVGQLAAANSRVAELEALNRTHIDDLLRAESEAAALREQVAYLKTEHDRVAESNQELLQEVPDAVELADSGWYARRDAHLSGQAPARTLCPEPNHDGHADTGTPCPGCEPADPAATAIGEFEQGYAAGWLQGQRDAPKAPERTDHERAVLEAENEIPDGTLKWLSSGDCLSLSVQAWAKALLARRETAR